MEQPLVKLSPMPAVPKRGLFTYAWYAVVLLRARWHRRAATRALIAEIKSNSAQLDVALGELGQKARPAGLGNRAFNDENSLISAADQRRQASAQALAGLTARRVEEKARDEAAQKTLAGRLVSAEEAARQKGGDRERLEGQRRAARERRRNLERQLRAVQKSIEEREDQAAKAQMGDARSALRRSAEDLRSSLARLEAQRGDLDKEDAAQGGPYRTAAAAHDAARAELEAARRAVGDSREEHRRCMAALEADQAQKSREHSLADKEVTRRLVTLGTIVNLNRIEQPELAPLYARIDELRAAIGTRESEVDRLNVERAAYDSSSLLRGAAVLGGAAVVVITVVCVLIAVF